MSKKHKAIEGEIVTASGPWRDLLLVCRKCSRKLDGGYGEKHKDTLPNAMKQVLRDQGRRRDVRILEVGCLGICPKDAVTVMHGAAPGEMLVVPEGLDLTLLAKRIGGSAIPDALTADAATRS